MHSLNGYIDYSENKTRSFSQYARVYADDDKIKDYAAVAKTQATWSLSEYIDLVCRIFYKYDKRLSLLEICWYKGEFAQTVRNNKTTPYRLHDLLEEI